MAIRLIEDTAEITEPSCPGSLLHGASAATTNLRARLRSIAPFFRTALITGAAGVGKRRVARELHRLNHPDGPFLLYRPEPRSVPGASPGCQARSLQTADVWAELLPSARGGTLVIEDIGDLPEADQESLLDQIQGPGWPSLRAAGTQIIGASCTSSRALLTSGRLCQELHTLFSAVDICIEPLRNRTGDIEELTIDLLAEAAAEFRLPTPQLSPEALVVLKGRHWPENVHELRSVLRAALRRESGALLTPAAFQSREVQDPVASARTSMRLQDAMDAHVSKVLGMCGGNKLKTAELLGVSRSTLYRMLEGMPAAVR